MNNIKRTLEDIKKEFGSLFFQAGQKQYEIAVLKKDLAVINGQLQELNFEAIKLQDEESKGNK